MVFTVRVCVCVYVFVCICACVHTDGHRHRSNSSFLPGWMRKKRAVPSNNKTAATVSAPSAGHTSQEESMEGMFHHATANLQQDVLAKYIVSQVDEYVVRKELEHLLKFQSFLRKL